MMVMKMTIGNKRNNCDNSHTILAMVVVMTIAITVIMMIVILAVETEKAIITAIAVIVEMAA